MPSLDDVLPELQQALAAHYGRNFDSNDPPEGTFEAVLAAFLGRVLTQQKVRALEAVLRDAGLMDAVELANVDQAELLDVVHQARLGASVKRLGALPRLARWFVDRRGAFDDASTEGLREELGTLNGIGPASADAILLHGLGRPAYPVDRASYRILVRHGWIDPSAGYDEARDAVERAAEVTPDRLRPLSEWFASVGADFCRASAPRCERCPLHPLLPERGPITPEDEWAD